jgi:UDP-N-acetylmuramate: L-alanyl-gamma-D-glutamyl-meso-diaminopimelate ligase
MHIHILGICGTFMGGIAAIAKELGHHVTGSDLNVYPPMSTQLEALGIELTQGWGPEQFSPQPDIVIIGNAMSRGNPAVEYVLNRKLNYCSGPEWLKQHLLKDRWVLAIAGTHGKTTTTNMLAWILEYAGFNPGYLIGGVPGKLPVSARAGSNPFFVIEADEYDTAFFDKRSKFVHYLPNTVVLNNLEFDHADIFANLDAIKTQFHHLLRLVPENGRVIYNEKETNLLDVINMGCWSEQTELHSESGWQALNVHYDEQKQQVFDVSLQGNNIGTVTWPLSGEHSVSNALAAIAAAQHAGISPEVSIEALSEFSAPKRRMEQIFNQHGIVVFDDFAHHPTAIETTLAGLRKQAGSNRIIAIIEPRSNTMKMGVHKETLRSSWQQADITFVKLTSDLNWQLETDDRTRVYADAEQILTHVLDIIEPNDHIVIMSNGAFDGLTQKLVSALQQRMQLQTS